MAADVSSTVGYMSGFSTEESKRARGGGGGGNEKPTALVTRDLLGGLHEIESRDLDLDLQVPAGWEKRLDLKVRFGNPGSVSLLPSVIAGLNYLYERLGSRLGKLD